MFLPCFLFFELEIYSFAILVKLMDMELLWYMHIYTHFNILFLRSTFWFDSPSIFRRFTACLLAYFLHFSSLSSITWGFLSCVRHLEWNVGGLALYLLMSGVCLTINQNMVICLQPVAVYHAYYSVQEKMCCSTLHLSLCSLPHVLCMVHPSHFSYWNLHQKIVLEGGQSVLSSKGVIMLLLLGHQLSVVSEIQDKVRVRSIGFRNRKPCLYHLLAAWPEQVTSLTWQK